MWRDKLIEKMEALGPGETVGDLRTVAWAAFAVAYNTMQWGLLQVALEKINVLAGRGLEGDAEGVSFGGCRWTATLAPGRRS